MAAGYHYCVEAVLLQPSVNVTDFEHDHAE
jgi:hypothetical protein